MSKKIREQAETQGPTQSVFTPRVRVLPDGRMNRRDAAAYLGVAPKTLAQWATQGKGPAMTRIGRLCFYFRDKLDRYIEDGE